MGLKAITTRFASPTFTGNTNIGGSSDLYLSRYAAKQLLISGDGTGATTNAGWIAGYFGTTGQSGLWSSTITPSSSNHTLFSDGGNTYVNAASGGTVGISVNGTVILAATSASLTESVNAIRSTTNGALWTRGTLSEAITLDTGAAFTDSTANLLPANSIIEAVVARVTTTITTSANWKLGDATTTDRFTAANSTLTAGTTDVGLRHQQGSISTDATGPVQTAAAKLRITLNAAPGAGAVRVTVFYRQFTPPTS